VIEECTTTAQAKKHPITHSHSPITPVGVITSKILTMQNRLLLPYFGSLALEAATNNEKMLAKEDHTAINFY